MEPGWLEYLFKMVFSKGPQSGYRDYGASPATRSKPAHLRPPQNTGAEAAYLKSLVDSRAEVTVFLNSGEQLRGRIRYYDRHCFSLRVAEEGPKLFLRKSEVLSIQE